MIEVHTTGTLELLLIWAVGALFIGCVALGAMLWVEGKAEDAALDDDEWGC